MPCDSFTPAFPFQYVRPKSMCAKYYIYIILLFDYIRDS